MNKQIVKTNPEPNDLNSRLDAYAMSAAVNRSAHWRDKLGNWPVYAAAAGSAFALTTSATADIIYSGPQNLTATGPGAPGYFSGTNFLKINVDGQGNSFGGESA